MSNIDYSFHHYNFCEVGSGVTIVSTGSGVGAEHAATVNASTKPTTIFFILYPFINIFSSYALIKAKCNAFYMSIAYLFQLLFKP